CARGAKFEDDYAYYRGEGDFDFW
nr:immunoglobulin heavy chain junction region [Macaca mulatta]MOX91726.1 immunoglobulin heavy chain junction region [Macaca mulatta]MOX92660.1 immunoglobulin heavy chain junction region [Macaca mulatta]MOX93690.1 immunoglobulin heavy chain junction region [Macaca mulatta]MOX94060.1 immunoglobulin heavy chain junction region [Macaca mulatta]